MFDFIGFCIYNVCYQSDFACFVMKKRSIGLFRMSGEFLCFQLSGEGSRKAGGNDVMRDGLW